MKQAGELSLQGRQRRPVIVICDTLITGTTVGSISLSSHANQKLCDGDLHILVGLRRWVTSSIS
jgi:hypothetical protein